MLRVISTEEGGTTTDEKSTFEIFPRQESGQAVTPNVALSKRQRHLILATCY